MRSTITLTAPEASRILSGATQIRVPIKPQPSVEAQHFSRGACDHDPSTYCFWPNEPRIITCPYSPASVLAVREPFVQWLTPDSRVDWSRPPLYKADDPEASEWWIGGAQMPAKLARLHLRVLTVRAQRVSDITEDEARACGFVDVSQSFSDTAMFLAAWRKRHGCAEWAWAIEFERVEVPRD